MSNLAPEHVEKMRNVIKQWIVDNGGSIDPASVIKLVTIAMRSAEEIVSEKAKGDYKKELVLQCIEIVMEETGNDDDAVLNVIRTVMPVAMDTIVDLSRGRLGPFKIPDEITDVVTDVLDEHVKKSCLSCLPL